MGSPSHFSIFPLLVLVFSVCHGAPTFQEYWNLVLPNTPMPAAVHDHLGEPTADVISSVHGKPVTMESNTKPRLIYSRKDGNGDSVVPSVDGKPDAVDSSTKPFFIYSNKDGRGDGVVSGVDGKPIEVDSSTKPFFFYSKKERGDGVVFGEVDSSTKPFFFYSKKERGDAVDGVVSGEVDSSTKPFFFYSKKDGITPDSNTNGERAGGHHPGAHHYIDKPKVIEFFLQRDLHVGAKIKATFRRGLYGDTFLHREVAQADAIPFSSKNFPEILRRYAVQPGSPMAKKSALTISLCEGAPIASEKKLCTTSLESMVDFVISTMGTNDLQTLTTVVGREIPPVQVYTVQSWTVVPTPNWTASICHVREFPYTVFYCHMIPQTKPYVLKMVGEDGTTVDAAGVCHEDTSGWLPTFHVLREFKLRPGEATVCHVIPEGDIIWYPRGARAAAL